MANGRISESRTNQEWSREGSARQLNPSDLIQRVLPKDLFVGLLCLERKRAERFSKHLLLMFVDSKRSKGRDPDNTRFLQQVAVVLCETIRESDIAGWLETNSVLGAVFTQLSETELSVASKTIESRFTTRLRELFDANQLSELRISFNTFPESWESQGRGLPVVPALYPDLIEVEGKKRLSLLMKRVMDIVGSALALIILAPIFLVLALLIKLSSSGPVLFRQRRVGRFGVPFEFWKFRSMHASTDSEIHKKYVRNFIAGNAEPKRCDKKQTTVYKITADPRVTRIGRFMRRTSLDELPQFWNVLKGEMSLVGPRPPIPYEIDAYDIWHRRRLLEVKPGITGLWQVQGRSRTTFDDMVRLDLRYSRTWSPLLDLKILLRTPQAVLSGDGAY